MMAQIDERLVAQLWERQAFDPSALAGLGLRVVFRGVPSDAGGPDYQDAILSQDERGLVAGDIEFHVLTSDWYRHGHQRDPRYNRVVLHVVWQDDGGETVRADGRSIPRLALSCWSRLQELPSEALEPPRLLTHPCVPVFAGLSVEELRERVRGAGLLRFRQRADSFSADMTCLSSDQVAYTALLEALGYASNRQVFRDLSLLVPYAWLQSVPPYARAPALLEAAGLGPPAAVRPPGHLPPGSWRLSRLRPGNHPALRLSGAILLLQRLGPNLAAGLASAVSQADKPSDLRALLMASQDGQALIGAGRADEIAVSMALPFVAALQLETGEAQQLFLDYPSPPLNRWTRIMQDLLAQAGHSFTPRLAAEHQGLHYLYHQHCRPERPHDCPVCGSEE
jgi:hypothetical protein